MYTGVLNMQPRLTVAQKVADACAWYHLTYGELPQEALISQHDLDALNAAGEKALVPCRVPKDRQLEPGSYWLGPVC
jgi:hypothetical protein